MFEDFGPSDDVSDGRLRHAAARLVARWFGGRDRQGRYGLHSVETMTEHLVRERARVDRTGGNLSLVVFAPRSRTSADKTLQEVATVLHQRLRSFDEAGWLDDEVLGVLLSGTDEAGGWIVADDVRAALPKDCESPRVRVYQYPTQTDDREETIEQLCSELAEQSPELTDEAEEKEKRVHAMEEIFVQPTPPVKRTMDVVGALVGLAILSPLLLAVATVIRLTSPGPVFFRQQRSGRGGKPFEMIKFRSMVVDAEARKQGLMDQNEQDGPAFKITNDPRITWIGKLIRATSIDELPQLWNVVRGEMSLVGPRPLPVSETAGCQRWQRQRLDVTPGLTCIWQVHGRSRVSFADWVRMDVRYIRSRTVFQDLKLILQTVPSMVLRKGS